MNTNEKVVLVRDGAVTRLVLNRPANLNAIDQEMAAGIQARLDDVQKDAECRCLVITGAGQAFCSGQQLPTDGADDQLPADLATLIRTRYIPIVTKIRELSIPVIAAVNGPAVGAGFSLALAADLRIAADDAWFGCLFSNVGLIPDAGASYFLSRYLGYPLAVQISLTGRRISAVDARGMHLVSEVFSSTDFVAETDRFARRLASGPTIAFALTKHALSLALVNPLEQQLELEADLQQQASETKDFGEGVLAFQQKRNAKFQGR
jgi:2-(1,2-epoxy-1,2-dihydrophenyl)acetyl-CoA isomerase